MDIHKQRKSFEQWLKTTGFYENAQDSAIYNEARFDVFDINNGFYRNPYVQLSWETWQAASTLVPPEGFILIPAKCFKFFSHDGDNYEVHDTLLEAKHEADCAIEHFRERLADQLSDPRSDGNFQDVGYGLILGHSNYSIDHVVTQDDIDQGNYPYEVGTEILSLFLVEAQEQSHD